jgi:hypothetical protein
MNELYARALRQRALFMTFARAATDARVRRAYVQLARQANVVVRRYYVR